MNYVRFTFDLRTFTFIEIYNETYIKIYSGNGAGVAAERVKCVTCCLSVYLAVFTCICEKKFPQNLVKWEKKCNFAVEK